MHTKFAAGAGAALLLVTAGLVAASPAAGAALPPKTAFTVVTSFVTDPSPIVAADGPWSDCTTVSSLSNVANQVSPSKVQFSGEKAVHCASGEVVVHYDAVTNVNGAPRTSGTWSVVSSTKPDVVGGGGTVVGEGRGCEACIVDTFTGRVY
jgi:hypothetical protein